MMQVQIMSDVIGTKIRGTEILFANFKMWWVSLN